MSELQILNKILRDKAIVIKENHFTYVERLFPQLGESPGIFLICKSIVPPTDSVHRELTKVKDESLEATSFLGHDVTGSPLIHSFGEESFNITIVGAKRNWSKDEENYLPLSKLQASTILNLCFECQSTKWSMPVFVLCDGSDEENIVLLGALTESEWFSTMKVCTTGLVGSSEVHNCSSLMEEHFKLFSVSKREVNVVVSSTYEFFGTNKNSVDWTENERTNFEGYLSLELSWNTLSFLPPMRTTSNYLVAQIAAGWKDSPLNDLWNQLSLLNQYLMILEKYQKKNLSSRYSVMPLMFPQSFSTPYVKKSEHLLENLNRLLSGDDDYEDDDHHTVRNNERPFGNPPDLDDNALLRSYLKELSSRQNLDFTDHLWRLSIGASDYAQMTDCLHTVFEEIVNNHYKPQINGSQPTRLANLINDLTSQNVAVPSLAGSFPLELIIDMGMEKMSRDYKYLLLSANLTDLHDMREKLSNVSTEEFNIDNYRTLLTTMARIHICLEFLLLVQNNLDCALDMSYGFFDYAMKLYTSNESPVKSFDDLIDNTIYTLKAPGSNAVLKEVAKVSPNTWRATLSSSRKARRSTTTTYYSLVPIFPPNIYNADDPIEEEESFHVTKVVSSSYQIR